MRTRKYPLESVEFNEATETYTGIYRGVPFTSTPDAVTLDWPGVRRRTLSWNAPRCERFHGDVHQAVVYLWFSAGAAFAARVLHEHS